MRTLRSLIVLATPSALCASRMARRCVSNEAGGSSMSAPTLSAHAGPPHGLVQLQIQAKLGERNLKDELLEVPWGCGPRQPGAGAEPA